jgi:hypothetical protein
VREDNGGNPSDSSQDLEAELPVARESSEPARAIEMTYWSEEPGLLEIIRAVACLRPETRTALLAFLAKAPDARRISAASNQGDLVLSLM